MISTTPFFCLAATTPYMKIGKDDCVGQHSARYMDSMRCWDVRQHPSVCLGVPTRATYVAKQFQRIYFGKLPACLSRSSYFITSLSFKIPRSVLTSGFKSRVQNCRFLTVEDERLMSIAWMSQSCGIMSCHSIDHSQIQIGLHPLALLLRA